MGAPIDGENAGQSRTWVIHQITQFEITNELAFETLKLQIVTLRLLPTSLPTCEEIIAVTEQLAQTLLFNIETAEEQWVEAVRTEAINRLAASAVYVKAVSETAEKLHKEGVMSEAVRATECKKVREGHAQQTKILTASENNTIEQFGLRFGIMKKKVRDILDSIERLKNSEHVNPNVNV